ncbi:MAG: hypothetical protein AB1393_11515 [Candidatus Edwardsbacteria bacterium]
MAKLLEGIYENGKFTLKKLPKGRYKAVVMLQDEEIPENILKRKWTVRWLLSLKPGILSNLNLPGQGGGDFDDEDID